MKVIKSYSELSETCNNQGECTDSSIEFELMINDNLSKQGKPLLFSNCNFKGSVQIKSINNLISFYNCVFTKKLYANDSVYHKGLVFNFCEFRDNALFYQTVCEEVMDFTGCEFYKPQIFRSVQFREDVNLSRVVFQQNVLFTYSTFSKGLFFRNTYFDHGIDLSLASIGGELSIFDSPVPNFRAEFKTRSRGNTEAIEGSYEEAVSHAGIIPVSNQRETFRVLKNLMFSRKNTVEYLRYRYLEMEAIRKGWKSERFVGDSFILWLNRISNKYGTNYPRAIIFTLTVAALFLFLTMISTDNFDVSLDPSQWVWQEAIYHYFEYLYPAHSSNFLGDHVIKGTWTNFFDFMGRVLVGYGIYQFIQAFRKFR